LRTRRWRKPDSNHRYRVTPPKVRGVLMSLLLDSPRTEKSARAVSTPRRRRALSRDRWFESGSLHRRVRCEPANRSDMVVADNGCRGFVLAYLSTGAGGDRVSIRGEGKAGRSPPPGARSGWPQPFGACAEGAAPGWGKLSTPLPTRAWPRAGPVTPSPVRSYEPAVKEMSALDDCARSPVMATPFLFCAPSPPRPLWRERRVAFRAFPSGVAKGRCMVLALGGLLDQ
jgi:hypothetical protein